MNFEILYSYLIDVTWLFLGSWLALLAAAYVVVFGRDRVWRAGDSHRSG
jgi:hypothetical protein